MGATCTCTAVAYVEQSCAYYVLQCVENFCSKQILEEATAYASCGRDVIGRPLRCIMCSIEAADFVLHCISVMSASAVPT